MRKVFAAPPPFGLVFSRTYVTIQIPAQSHLEGHQKFRRTVGFPTAGCQLKSADFLANM